ncbi:MAG: hypothetical protein H7A25_00730 [Leptospiraceae bacterium]|nr:hypothetical protein [Leptospiraceae bacterium]MCP5498402.1 hypothetical protein [Leptospiraceae bacterium]
MKFSKYLLIQILVLLFTTALFAEESALESNKKPIPNEGRLTEAVDALENAKSENDSVKGSREGSSTAKDENTTTDTNGAPVTTTTSTIYVNSRTAFEISAGDKETKVDYIEYKINGGDYQKYTSPLYLPAEGITTIAYRAVDIVGNKEAAKVLSVTVDNTPPTTSVKPVEKIFVNEDTKLASLNGTYKIIAEDKVSGVDKVFYSVNDGPKQEYTGQPIKLTNGGPTTIKTSAIDKAGNESDETSYVINVDNVAPSVKIVESQPLINVDGKFYAKKGTTFSVKAADVDSGISKILVKLDGEQEFTSFADPISFTTGGEHTIEAKAIDNVGNESQPAVMKVMVDVMPPSTLIKAEAAAEPKK